MTSLDRTASLPVHAVRWSKRVGVQRYLRLLSRLSQMTPGEAAARGIQIPLRRLIAARTGSSRPLLSRDRKSASIRVHVGPLRQWLSTRFDERFFFGPSFRRTVHDPQVRSCLAPARIVRMATALGSEGLEILGLRLRVVAGQIDWQADPRSRREAWSHAGLDEASAIGNTDADVKYVWEVNRQQYLTLLGRAFWHTDDPQFARDAVALIDDWIAANPYGHGVNWSSHLEVAMRAISWLWTMPYLLAWADIDEAFLRRWLDSLTDHYRHLAANLSIYTDPTNHLIGETTGLWMLCTMFPELPEAPTERARASEILAREFGRQIAPDGVNREQATSYQRFVLDFLLQVIALARRGQEPLPPVFHERAESALAFVGALTGPTGDVPMIGDSDDARGIPLPELVGWDFRDLLSTGAVIFSRPEWKAQAGTLAEATVWLLGVEAAETFDRIEASTEAPASTMLAEGGYCVFRTETPSRRIDTILDAGPLGLLPNAAHGHADALSLMIRVNGELLLTDPGTGTYFSDRGVRDWFRSTAAHNTLTVDGLDQADLFDVFKWVNPMRVELMAAFSGKHVSYALGRHDGYGRLRQPVRHFRHVLSIHRGLWFVIDCLQGNGEHHITSRYHFEPGTRVISEPNGAFVTVSPRTGSGLRFTFAEPSGSGGVTADEPGLWSDRYGSWQEAPQLRYDTSRSMPAVLCTTIGAVVAGHESAAETERIAAHDVQPLPDGGVLWRSSNGCGDQYVIVVNPGGRRVGLPDGRTSTATFLFLCVPPATGSALMFSTRDTSGESAARFVHHERFAPSDTLQV